MIFHNCGDREGQKDTQNQFIGEDLLLKRMIFYLVITIL